MNNQINAMFKQLNDLLKGDTPSSVDKMLKSLGVSKEEVLNKLNTVNKEELLAQLNSKEVSKALDNLSPADLEKLKNLKMDNKDEVENFLKSLKNPRRDG